MRWERGEQGPWRPRSVGIHSEENLTNGKVSLENIVQRLILENSERKHPLSAHEH